MNFHEAYYQDVEKAATWYEKRQCGLGLDFLNELNVALERIRTSPEACSLVTAKIRVACFERFPYGIYFRNDQNGAFILGVLHLHRHESSWKQRRSFGQC